MGQSDLFEYLKGRNDWVNQTELKKIMGLNRSSVYSNVKRLVKRGVVDVSVKRLPGISHPVSFFKIKSDLS
jgi:predicted transcriptional regulator